jgi:N-acetylneuraminic acid mutarotase
MKRLARGFKQAFKSREVPFSVATILVLLSMILTMAPPFVGPVKAWGWGTIHAGMAKNALAALQGFSSADLVEICGAALDADRGDMANGIVYYHRAREYRELFNEGDGRGAEYAAWLFLKLARESYHNDRTFDGNVYLGYAIHFIQDSVCPAHVFPFKEGHPLEPHTAFEIYTDGRYAFSNWPSLVGGAAPIEVYGPADLRQRIVEAADRVNRFSCDFLAQNGTAYSANDGVYTPIDRNTLPAWGYRISDDDIGGAMEGAASLVKGAAIWAKQPGLPVTVGQGARNAYITTLFDACYYRTENQVLGPGGDGGSILGDPIDNAAGSTHRWGNGYIQDFRGGDGCEGAIMKADGADKAYALYGTIWSKYAEWGGAEGQLGYPTSDVIVGSNVSCYFQGGRIEWVPPDPAVVLIDPAYPDLTVTSVSAPTSAQPGGYISVSWMVKNIGSASSGPFRNLISLSTAPYGTLPNRLGYFSMNSITRGSSLSDARVLQVPGGITPGYYYVTVYADADDAVAEPDPYPYGENNNIDHASSQIFISASAETVSAPEMPGGSSAGEIGQSLTYTTGDSSSSLGHNLEYRFEWGDGTYSSWSSSISAAHSWSVSGTFTIRAQARCAAHTSIISSLSPGKSVTINPPETVSTPDMPSGSSAGQVGQSLAYTTGGSSSNLGDSVEYRFDWGDGSPYSSWSSSTSAAHSWSLGGPFTIRVQARCAAHTTAVSAWSYGMSLMISDTKPPQITYLSLNHGYPVKTGHSYSIAFIVSDKVGIDSLDFCYSTDNGNTWSPIVTDFVIGSNGLGDSYRWTIPADAPLTTEGRIKMIARDTSDNEASHTTEPFSIIDGTPPGVTILSPKGGEVWDLGSEHEIKWNASSANGISALDIYLYYGDRAEFITRQMINDGSYTWTLPASSTFVTSSGRIKVRVYDGNGNEAECWSEGYFSISDPSLPPPAPWVMPERVTTVPSGSSASKDHTSPRIAVDKDGIVHLVYKYTQDSVSTTPRVITQNILYRKLTGSSWSSPELVYSLCQETYGGSCHWIRDLQIAVDSTGTPHVVWTDTGAGTGLMGMNFEEIYHSYRKGSSWTPSLNIADNSRVANFQWWMSVNELPEPKCFATSAVASGKIYAIGGSSFLQLWERDPLIVEWTRKADMPNGGLGNGGAAVVNGKIYAIGADFAGSPQLLIYNPVDNNWQTGTPMPSSREGVGVAPVNGKIYAIGGGAAGTRNEMYDPATNTWSTMADMPTSRGFASVAVVGNLIYAIGGQSSSGHTDVVEVYDPASNTWSTRSPMPTTRSGAAIGVINNRIYVVGGFDGHSYLNTVEVYYPSRDMWTTLNPVLTPRAGSVGAVINNTFYLIGGEDGSGNVRLVERGILNGITDENPTVSIKPGIAIDASDNVHVVWQDGYSYNSNRSMNGVPSIYYKKMEHTSGAWSSVSNIRGDGASYPDIAADNLGNLHLVFEQGGKASYMVWNGTAWSPATEIVAGDNQLLDVVSDASNRLHLTLANSVTDENSNFWLRILYSYCDGNTWSSPEEVSDRIPGHYPNHPLVMADSLGRPHIIWEDPDDGSVNYKRKSALGWSDGIKLNLDSQYVWDASSDIAISGDDHLYVVWCNDYNGHTEIFYNHADVSQDITPPRVTLIAPSAGEHLLTGSSYNISWNSLDDCATSTVSLEYTVDEGSHYTGIAANISDTGSCVWTVPDVVSDQVQIRISVCDTSGNIGSLTSDYFSIGDGTSPNVNLTSPNGGEVWVAGSQHNITWSATDNVAVTSIDIYYSTDGGSTYPYTIATGEANDGTYLWTIPNTQSETCKVKVIAYDAADNHSECTSDADFEILRENDQPTAPVIDVAPGLPLTTDHLVCTITMPSTDTDGDIITYAYQWYKDEVLQAGLPFGIVPSFLTAKGEVWRCVVTPTDGILDGAPAEHQVIVQNSPPTAPIVDITPDIPLSADDLLCTVSAPGTDPDDDAITYIYQWYKNGVLEPELTTNIVPAVSTAKGEVWRCVVTPNDGSENGVSSQDQVTIQNVQPTAPMVDVTPDMPLTTDNLVCSITTPSVDSDGDSLTYTYQWYENGVLEPELTTNVVPAASTAEGEIWRCVVVSNDGTVNGLSGEDEVTIISTGVETPPGSDVTITLDSAAVTFETVTAGGTTSATTSTGNPGGSTPSGFRIMGLFVDITTTATYIGLVTVGIRYDESGVGNESNLKLFHWSGAHWDDVTTWVDTDNNIVYGEVGALSWFFIGESVTGCFIATAAYGTPMAEEIQILREFRDEYLLTNPVGQVLVGFYYRVSPPMADFITEHPSLKPIVRALLAPAVGMSMIAVNTTPAEKMTIVGLLVGVSVALVIWETRRRKGRQYT